MKNRRRKIIKWIFIFLILGALFIFVFKVNLHFLMGNVTYEKINIKEKEQYTISDNYVSECESSNSSIVKVKTVGGKCILTGVSKGTTDVGLFIASDGIQNKTYNVNVSSSVKINKRFRISIHTLILNIDTNNINNIDFKYCMVNKNKSCSRESINNNKNISIHNNSIRFNNLNSNIKKVCLYAYDDNRMVDSLCINRGIFNIFW